MTLCILIILCVEMWLQMMQKSNKLTEDILFLTQKYSSFCIILIIVGRARSVYNRNSSNTSLHNFMYFGDFICRNEVSDDTITQIN
jgi:hypothetical protein